jgi:hypothetical protein
MLQRLFALALCGAAAAQTEGDVQLVNGRTSGAYDGLLQVYYNNASYSVCDDNFEDDHASFVCQQLFGTTWTSWTTDLGHCYTPVTGCIVDLGWTVTGTTLADNVEGSTTMLCDHDEDVSVVYAFDASASTEDQALDLSCVAGDCAPGYKQCGDSWTWCCGDDYPDCGDSWGWCEDKKSSKKTRQAVQGVLIGILCGIVLLIALSVLACCLCCPNCPMYRCGPKPAAAPPQASVEMAGVEMYPVVTKA